MLEELVQYVQGVQNIKVQHAHMFDRLYADHLEIHLMLDHKDHFYSEV